jgi:hypothetical protein
MQFYIFICNNQELSKSSYMYSKIYLVKYLYFSCTNKNSMQNVTKYYIILLRNVASVLNID